MVIATEFLQQDTFNIATSMVDHDHQCNILFLDVDKPRLMIEYASIFIWA